MSHPSTKTKALNTNTLLIAGGCFWCVEADIKKLPGILSAVSGYAGGTTENPTYENYAEGGHREVVEVSYDANQITFPEIIIYAIKHMDPTDGDGSFHDRGEAYAPALYYENATEEKILKELVADIQKNGPYQKPLAVPLLKRPVFWKAETYHQNYCRTPLGSLRYPAYREASGRDAFMKEAWGDDTGTTLPWQTVAKTKTPEDFWHSYTKPDLQNIKNSLDQLTYSVTQEEGTEPAGTHPYDKCYERGIYVDVLSGEPLFSSRDKYDSGSGWPSFVQPITEDAVTEKEDQKHFSTRTEIRSRTADNHLGHVFPDGPKDRGGLRYCINGAALRFIPETEMAVAGYASFLKSL